jgi:hypothetical protein
MLVMFSNKLTKNFAGLVTSSLRDDVARGPPVAPHPCKSTHLITVYGGNGGNPPLTLELGTMGFMLHPSIHPMALQPKLGLGLLYRGSVTIMFYGLRLLASRPTPVNFVGPMIFCWGVLP